jgi:hypothetical protein
MSEDTATAVARLKAQISNMLRRVPDKVNAGGYQTAVEYKKLAVEGHKLVASHRATFIRLSTVCNQLSAYG